MSGNKKNIFLLTLLTTLLISIVLISCSSQKGKQLNVSPKGTEVNADEALNLLKDGNKRFVDGKEKNTDLTEERKSDLFEDGQYPYAVIISCSDSRVPPELLFNEGFGNIFVIRNAGNVVDQISLGSIEYGVEHLGAPLIMVLGHEKCGAVKATIDGGDFSENIGAIAKGITPAYNSAKISIKDNKLIYSNTEDENIKQSVNEIKNSEVIKHLLEENKVKVVGAKYSLETGKVIVSE
ncbi:carbonic anhydrase [Clostridium gasigenes]|uniref:carbonic anhydrase n=1 Tax=Clostridium gasigenes TaxID=94869 RepID=UPI001C0DD296|nr:carbonic anhydrase [Clostridium gasigenes]MBU3109129.1 carbonic anhydrase [Clostridium gasigenes]